MSSAHDLLVLGGGSAGLTAARAAAHAGARTLLVDRAPHLGGECTFTGCIPSKALLEVARLRHQLRSAGALGLHVDGVRLDFRELMAHKDRVVESVSEDESDEAMQAAGVDVVHATAVFTGPHTVALDGVERTVDRVVLAHGCDPTVPPIPGIADVAFLTNETLFSITELPRRLVVLGGGPIGCEMAQCFARLGSEVTLVGRAPRLLPRDDVDASLLLARALQREGLTLRLGVDVTGVAQNGDGVRLAVRGDDGPPAIEADTLLVATGRSPRLGGLGLDRLGVRTGPDGIPVDSRCRTSVEHVFAAGDITGTHRFTHWAAHQGRVAGLNAAGKRATVDDRVVPWVTFTDPEVAHVGETEAQARERHRDVEVVRFPFALVDRARTMAETEGFVKISVDRGRLVGGATGGSVVGATIVGVHAGEMLAEVALSMQARTFAGRLAQTIHAYPTLSLGVQQAAAQLFARGRALTPARDVIES